MTSKPKLCGVISIKIILVTNIWEYLQEFNRLYKVILNKPCKSLYIFLINWKTFTVSAFFFPFRNDENRPHVIFY